MSASRPDLAAGVYVGYDEPDSLGTDAETGGHLAAPIFRDFMTVALKDAPATEFRTPPGMRMYRVNPGDRAARRRPASRHLGGLQARHRARQGPRARPAPAAERRGAVQGAARPLRPGPATGTGGLY